MRSDDREILFTRHFDASPNLVWRAWTDSDVLGEWWGPDGFTTTTHSMDFRVDGQWRFDMIGPDKRVYSNLITYQDIVENERLVYAHTGVDNTDDVAFTAIVTFDRTDTGTKLTLRMVFPSKEDRDRVCREYGAVDGGIQHVANLAAYLAPGSDAVSNVLTIALPNEHDIIFSRNFDAPRDLVWKAMTDPDMLRQWVFLPPGWEMTMCEDEHRVDGSFRREWKHPHGDMAVHGTYAEFQPPERLVRSEIFDMGCDAPMADEIATLVLTELATERGTITNMHMTFRYTSQAARDGALKSGMDRGMEAGYRNLDGLFAETHHARG